MKPSKHTLLRTGVIVLYEGSGDARFCEQVRPVGFQEETALIAELLGNNLDDIRDISLNKLHELSLESIILSKMFGLTRH